MRIVALAALAALCFSSAALATEKNPNQILVLDIKKIDSVAVKQVTDRIRVAAARNTQVALRAQGVKSVFIFWLDENNHLMEFARISVGIVERELLARDSDDGLHPYLVPDSKTELFALAQKALDSDQPAEAAEEFGLPDLVQNKTPTFVERWAAQKK